MRPKLLFLAKLFAYSFGLFALWHPVSQVYVYTLNGLLNVFNSLDNFITGVNAVHIGEMTEYFIPFAALILASPGITLKKKIGALSAGALVFLLADFSLFEYALLKGNLNGETSPVFFVVTDVKLLVPFTGGIIIYPHLRNMFRSKGGIGTYLCPICEEEHSEIITHIEEVHGEKSLRMKKVRRFLSENPSLSVDSTR